jgi:hypothetical protein
MIAAVKMSQGARAMESKDGGRGLNADFAERSSLYQEFLAEREEILRHKWLESEKLGYDIGFERALLDWIRKHRDKWRSARRSQAARARGKKASPGASAGRGGKTPTGGVSS